MSEARHRTPRELVQGQALEDQAWAHVSDNLKHLLQIFDADSAAAEIRKFHEKPMAEYTADEETATKRLVETIVVLRNIRQAFVLIQGAQHAEETPSHHDEGSGEFPTQHL